MSISPGSRMRRPPIPILSYHQTEITPPRGVPWRELVLPPSRFARQMKSLRMLGYTGLSMTDLEPYLHGEKTGKVVGITLDDGYLNNFANALPVLRDVGFTATSYVVSGQFGGSNVWDHGEGVPPSRLMDVAHLKAWVAAGMDVGAHTRNHVDLLQCDEATARQEIAGCKADLENALDVQVRHFCYPYGRHRPETAEMVRQAGYVTATTVVPGRTQWDDNPMMLPRIPVELPDVLPVLLAKTCTGYLDVRRAAGRALRRRTAAVQVGVLGACLQPMLQLSQQGSDLFAHGDLGVGEAVALARLLLAFGYYRDGGGEGLLE
jgi:peptidoglycan/xylan/chitin deacetylase (PgdA/CDA1 family)